METQTGTHALIPLQWVGPLSIDLGEGLESVSVPMATYETTLWPSTGRGARISQVVGGIKTFCVQQGMTRSILVSAPDMQMAIARSQDLKNTLNTLQEVTSKTSRYARLISLETDVVGRLLYVRFTFKTGDAAGHNMTTKASDALLRYILEHYSELTYESISSNFCTDKKVSAVNSLLGRGYHILADIKVPRKICEKYLKTTPEALERLNHNKNFLGGILAGSLRSANAHFANTLLATYLATGQDAANIVEGSQGITHVEVVDEDLYFSIKCPNIIVGTVGNGKEIGFVQQALEKLGCTEKRPLGMNSQRLARIIGATILCSELSLMAAQTNPGELTRSHMVYER